MTDFHALINIRLVQAQETIQEAKLLLEHKQSSRSVVNRSYYACFYAVLALFVSKHLNITTSKHIGVISMFDKEFILSGAMDKKYSEYLHRLFLARQQGDYKAITVDLDSQDAKRLLDCAGDFVNQIKKMVTTNDDRRETKD